jgi:hypothetical protein
MYKFLLEREETLPTAAPHDLGLGSVVRETSAIFAEEVRDFVTITTCTEIFTVWGQHFEEMQALVFACGAKQFMTTEWAFAFADDPGTWSVGRVGHTDNKNRKAY